MRRGPKDLEVVQTVGNLMPYVCKTLCWLQGHKAGEVIKEAEGVVESSPFNVVEKVAGRQTDASSEYLFLFCVCD